MTASGNPSRSRGTDAMFSYRALRADGASEGGEIRATDRATALSALAARGLFPIEVYSRRQVDHPWSARIPTRDLAIGLQIMATLLESGLPVRRAAAAFESLAPTTWRPIVAAVLPALREGRSLSAAFSESLIALPPVIIGIIRAGEAGGTVGNALRSAAELAEDSAATKAAIRAALAYPLILALAGSASVAVLVGFVLPRFADLLGELNQSLPPTTRFVLSASYAIRRAGLPLLLLALLALGVIRARLADKVFRERLHEMLLSIPTIGQLRHAAATSRACGALAALLETGVPVGSALSFTASAAGDAAVAARVLRARESIIAGSALGNALQARNAFTAAAVRLIRAGEETGRLSPMLAQAARLERERATEGVRRLVRLLEPSLILLFAGLVAFVAAALLQAVYSIRPA